MSMSTPQERLAKRDREMIPIVLVRAMFFLALLSLALVAYARFTDRPLVGVASAPAITQSVEILYTPGAERGSYVVTDMNGSPLISSADHKAGFVGVIGQALGRKRMLAGVDPATPLSVVRRENGRIDIIDPATNFTVELMGYGADNVAAFAQLLD